MTREEFDDEVRNIYSLVDFCYYNGYDNIIDDVYSGDSYESCVLEEIVDDIRSSNINLDELKDWISDLPNAYDNEYYSNYDGWEMISAQGYAYEELRENLVTDLENDGFFDDDVEDDEESDDDKCGGFTEDESIELKSMIFNVISEMKNVQVKVETEINEIESESDDLMGLLF